MHDGTSGPAYGLWLLVVINAAMAGGAVPDLRPGTGCRRRVRRLGVATHQEPVICMHADCPVCRSRGFGAEERAP